VRRRIEALEGSTASLVLFLEYIPQTLHEWLGDRTRGGDESAGRACALVEDELSAGVAFMNARGLLHLDIHFENVLTDGSRLYFADFGLAISSRFDLARDEVDFLHEHRDYDSAFTAMYLVNWLAVDRYGHGPDERRDLVSSWATGERPAGVPSAVAAILVRRARVAAVMGDYASRFRLDSRVTPFPVEALRRAGVCEGQLP